MRSSDRPLWAIAGVVALLVLAAVLATAFGDATADLDPESPEGVVQRYLQAVTEGDEEAALALLADTPGPGCYSPELGDSRIRTALSQVEVDGDEAEVHVLVTVSGGDPPFGRYQFSEAETFRLRSTPEGWRIEDVPWRFTVCP